MRVVEGLGNLSADSDGFINRNLLAFPIEALLVEAVPSGNCLHDEKIFSGTRESFQVGNGGDVRVVELLDKGEVLPNLLHFLFAGRDLARDEFNGALDPSELVVGEEDFAHAAASEVVAYFETVVWADAYADSDVTVCATECCSITN